MMAREGFRPGCVLHQPVKTGQLCIFCLSFRCKQNPSASKLWISIIWGRELFYLALTGILYYRKHWDGLQVRYLSLIKTEYCLAEKHRLCLNHAFCIPLRIIRQTESSHGSYLWNTYQEQKVNEGNKNVFQQIEMLFFNHWADIALFRAVKLP